MKILTHFFTLMSIFIVLSGCGTKNLEDAVNDGAQKLNSLAIRELLRGSTVNASGYGQEAVIIFHDNFKLSATNNNKEKDSGNWKINEDQLCLRFYQWGEKQTLCYQVYETDDEVLLFNSKGMQLYSFTIVEKSSTNFQEGISHTSSENKKNNSANSSVIADIPQATKFTFTKKTAEDVQYFVRQTAQNCPGCNLAKAQLSGLVLIGANLEGANLTEADLSSTVLRRANLKGANLYKADLRDANLMGADLTGANLTEADITGAHTQGAIGYSP